MVERTLGKERREGFTQVDASAQEEFSGVLAREKEGFREASIRLRKSEKQNFKKCFLCIMKIMPSYFLKRPHLRLKCL